ncbi:MAG TPA: hypothetical protein VJY62_12565 [Bacteroidia bacterium]|nr:hypothetical protein [Bacteroidia bacterium]
MIIYNKDWLDNLRIHETAENWFRKSFITPSQLTGIKQEFFSGYKHTNLFVRIGLFLFTFILATSAIGLVMLFMSAAIDSFGVIFLVFAGILWFVLEQFVKEKKYFRNGIDDMLLYISLGYFISGISVIVAQVTDTIDLNGVLIVAVIGLPVLVFAAVRFADAFVSLVAYVCLLLIIFILVHKTGTTGKALMPFAIMVVSFLVYVFVVKFKKEAAKIYWRHCLSTIETASLITLYAAGNYFVVRESSALLFNLSLQPGEDIPLAIVFYALTLAIPVAYIITGIRNKDRIPLRTGIILAALSVLTYRYYYHFMNAEAAMIIAGVFLVAVSWLVIKKLQTPWNEITFKDTGEEPSVIEAESLLIAQTFGQQATKKNDVEFGGGSFGGGGAGGNF